MTRIAFLACETTLPGNTDRRRGDAYEHDLMMAALEPAFAERGLELVVIDWEAPLEAFDDITLAMLGTAWNYQDKPPEFLARLEALEDGGVKVCNPPEIVRWNMTKTYLRGLAEAGAATIPTLWRSDVTRDTLAEAFEHFDTEKLVVKRQVGAGALDQILVSRGALPDRDWNFGHRAMIQPYLPSIASKGELSFIFIDGELSHALRKRAAEGDYRIQSLYGGVEEDYSPSENEVAAARNVLDAIPFAPPLYSRIDMLVDDDGAALVMEAELIEPYLYPEQGPQVGEHLATAVEKRIG